MAQIREGCFRVIATNPEDIDFVNLHRSPGKLVSIEREHRLYSDSLEERLSNLKPGNCVTATIQSEDVYRVDGIWRALEIERFEKTELHAVEVDEIITPDMMLMEGAFEDGQSEPKVVHSDGKRVGYKIGLPDSRGSEAHGPVMTTYKECYKTLKSFGSPPYEIISITQPKIPLEIRYYLAEKGTSIASDILDASEYLVGQSR